MAPIIPVGGGGVEEGGRERGRGEEWRGRRDGE